MSLILSAPSSENRIIFVSSDRSSYSDDDLFYIYPRTLFQIFTQSRDAIDVTSVTLSRLKSINAIDVTRYLGDIFGISLGYLWDILGISLGYLWDILEISWGYIGDILGISWGYLGDILGISWGYFGDILVISWGYFGDIFGISLGYLWDNFCRSVPPEFLQSFFSEKGQ